jgi:hypothetical protein
VPGSPETVTEGKHLRPSSPCSPAYISWYPISASTLLPGRKSVAQHTSVWPAVTC